MDIKDVIRQNLAEWMADEYEEPLEETLEKVQGDVFGIAYSQYEDGEVCVDEQWMVDLNPDRPRLYLELDGRQYDEEVYEDLEDMEENLEWLDFDELIGEADDWVERWKEDFK